MSLRLVGGFDIWFHHHVIRVIRNDLWVQMSLPGLGQGTLRAVEKKRFLEDERKQRIFDAKARTIGVDKDALDEQVKERNSMRELAQDREEYLDAQAAAMDKHAVFLESEQQRLGRLRQVNTQLYREQYQKKESGRTWDLNDPQRITTDVPARIGDVDPRFLRFCLFGARRLASSGLICDRCGPASIQKFDGEDLQATERKQAQAAQMRRWIQQQVDERDVKKWHEQEQSRQYDERTQEATFRAHEISQNLEAQRRENARATADYNKAMAQNQLDSDILNENPIATLNVTNPNRFKNDGFKGLLEGQRSGILQEQAQQRDELLRRRQKEAEDERQWAAQDEQQRRMGLVLERQRERDRRETALQLAEERKIQAAEQTLRKKDMNTVFANEITEEFYNKFNTTTR
eukprot:gene11679-2123_t